MDSDLPGALSNAPSSTPLNPVTEGSATSSAPIKTRVTNVPECPAADKDAAAFPAAYQALLMTALAAAGSYAILPIWLLMGRLWLNDPLRAIGAAFPLLALAGTLAAWRPLHWRI